MRPLLARLLLIGVSLAGLSGGVLWAQTDSNFARQQRQYDERLREQLDRPRTAEQRMGVDWGGWFNTAFMLQEDTEDKLRDSMRSDLYLWGRAVVDDGHEFYARGRFSYIDYIQGDGPSDRGHDWQGPAVDRLYYSFDLRNAALRKQKVSLPYNAFTTVGRQYVQFGTGLALSLPMDAVVVGGEAGNTEVKGLFGRTIESINNIDQSPPVASHSNRDFYGVQATYKGIAGHEPFAYYLWQQDHTKEDPNDPVQEYDYDSQYLGLGSKGRAFLRNLYYQTELALEQGRSFGVDATADPDKIRALAYDLMLDYLFQNRFKPKASAEYLFATGDGDRKLSPTDTLGGNKPGTTDNGFNAFGYRNTGLAFAAPISNLHMFRVGGSFKPLPQCRRLSELALGADAFAFLKARDDGAGPDTRSIRDNPNLGQEVDIYCNWRITSDLLWTIRYGVFVPGDSYEGTRSTRNFLFTGFTFSF